MKIDARWVNDCQGKQDYDGPLVSFSSRYWPSGGGFHILDASGFRPSTDANIKPSAVSEIILNSGDGASLSLAKQEFTGDSEVEVKSLVEAWAQQQMDAISELLLEHFKVKPVAAAVEVPDPARVETLERELTEANRRVLEARIQEAQRFFNKYHRSALRHGPEHPCYACGRLTELEAKLKAGG